MRNRQIAFMTIYAMVLVVIGHSDITVDYKELWIFKWIYSFHMPLFFFISGLLFQLTNPLEQILETSYRQFVKKKSVRLLIPFLFINTLIFLIKSIFFEESGLVQNQMNLSVEAFIEVTCFSPTGYMWFLPTLFTIFLLSYPLWRVLLTKGQISNRFSLICLLILATMVSHSFLPEISFMQFSNALYYWTYFLLGILYAERKVGIDSFLRSKGGWIIPMTAFLSATLLFEGYLSAVVGIVLVTSLSLKIENKVNQRLAEMSQLCFVVYLLSYFPQMLVRGPLAHAFPMVNQYYFSVLSFLLGLLLPVLVGIVVLECKRKYSFVKRIGVLIGI